MHSEDIDEDFVRRAAALLAGIELTAAQVPGVIENLRRTATIAATVNEFRLDVVDEPGPVWRL
ncbi:MAG: DUF4089 domain-containing protein [Betaproteobacteria bacterium]